jgi:hypothetical protein
VNRLFPFFFAHLPQEYGETFRPSPFASLLVFFCLALASASVVPIWDGRFATSHVDSTWTTRPDMGGEWAADCFNGAFCVWGLNRLPVSVDPPFSHVDLHRQHCIIGYEQAGSCSLARFLQSIMKINRKFTELTS